MQRRTLMRLGVFSATTLSLMAWGVGVWRPGLQARRLAPAGREVFRAVALAVLAGTLPEQAKARDAALLNHLDRLDTTLAGLPAAMVAEIAQMTALLAHPAGRRLLAGIDADWTQVAPDAVHDALQSMRTSRLELRQQVYHALRDLTNAAYFADPGTWAGMGYAGPRPV